MFFLSISQRFERDQIETYTHCHFRCWLFFRRCFLILFHIQRLKLIDDLFNILIEKEQKRRKKKLSIEQETELIVYICRLKSALCLSLVQAIVSIPWMFFLAMMIIDCWVILIVVRRIFGPLIWHSIEQVYCFTLKK